MNTTPRASVSSTTALVEPDSTVGAKYYSSLALTFYDLWVVKISSSFAWGCGTASVLQPYFTGNFSQKHMDVGVGTGYFPATALKEIGDRDESPRSITLVDLNQNSLELAMKRIDRPDITRSILADALRPLPGNTPQFDSISLFYLLHCLPGPPEHKAAIFKNLKGHLNKGGVLFGATVLGSGVQHNLFGQLIMAAYNWAGVFDNRADSEEVFVQALKGNFARVEVEVVGRVLLFRAWEPI
ncbi:SAM-dependent methyltransferase [Fusarium heterosporum]|uniref:SAM-dependent methyltransferase n=1 Tax=Fusarium heterosporum TaxID=42747 RepID=A0A8H5U1D4_FUSHE|nr:SAM-dependent methyltransferase [Fusarium heterosporum]